MAQDCRNFNCTYFHIKFSQIVVRINCSYYSSMVICNKKIEKLSNCLLSNYLIEKFSNYLCDHVTVR